MISDRYKLAATLCGWLNEVDLLRSRGGGLGFPRAPICTRENPHSGIMLKQVRPPAQAPP
jgi:hypothetical protein